MGPSGALAYAMVMELKARCEAKRDQASVEALLAEAEAARHAQQQRAERSRQLEEKRMAEQLRDKNRLAKEEQRRQMLAQGLVEVRIDPLGPWTREWLQDVILPHVPELNAASLDRNLGTGALLYGLNSLRAREESGKKIGLRAAYVVDKARGLMAGKYTIWVTADVAAQKPELIVPRHD